MEELRRLIEDLSSPAAYPHKADDLEVHHTHISVVFLAGEYAYKVKKPLDLGFLDFTSLDLRLHYCREEIRLNRRLAAQVYLDVVPITVGSSGLVLEGDGEPVEYAVKMRRLPEGATLRERLARDGLDPSVLKDLASRIADFHREADSNEEIARYGRWDVVAENARENLSQSQDQVGRTVSEPVFERLGASLETRLEQIRPLVEDRAERKIPCDTHGDLHLDHVYLFPDRPPPDDLVVVDCIEFSERFRFADPVSDPAFLAMDLIHHGRPDLAQDFSDTYLQASGDDEGRELFPFYRSYRAAVRGKVEGIASAEEEVPEEERKSSEEASRRHWLLALSELEEAGARPGLVLVSGLPGTGKSTLARGLARTAKLHLLSSDRVRKGLAGLEPDAEASAAFGEGIYTQEWTERTYGSCLQEVRERLFR